MTKCCSPCPPAGPRLSRAGLASLAMLAGVPAALGQASYLLLGADTTANLTTVRDALVAAGLTNVDVYPMSGTLLPTPTLAELLAYDAVLTYTNYSYADGDAMGTMLADYVDAGGGVVCAVYCVSTLTVNRSLLGRWASGGYDIIPQRSGNDTSATALGTVHLPAHPIWAGMTGFSGGTFARAITLNAAPHAVRIADWATGGVLAATSTQFPGRVDLNFYPGVWAPTPDGARLLVNALVHAGNAAVDPPPGACCYDDGTCQITLPANCLPQGGIFRGSGSTCGQPCPQPAACCFPDGSCARLVEGDCTAQGGVFNAAAPTCATANCPQPPTGACCTADGTCTVTWVGGCEAVNGAYRGDNTTCSAGLCRMIVVPAAQAAVEGNTNNNIPFTTTVTYYHYQQVNAAAEFASVSGPHRITRIRMRPDANSTYPAWSNSFDLQMTFSTTTAGPDALSSTFASNIGPDATLVYTGNCTVSTEQTSAAPYPPGPRLFDVDIPLQTPFVYNPAGGNLLIDVIKTGSTIGTSRPLDLENTTGDGVSRLLSATQGSPTGTLSTGGLVIQFHMEPVAGACYPNCDNSTAPPVLNVQDFTCFLQRYAAGESYANCDNSTAQPVLNVQDFTCFLQRYAAGCP